MTPEEVKALAVRCKVDELPDTILAAILAINNDAASLDRRDVQALTVHNNRVLAAHQAINDWRQSPSDFERRFRRAELQSFALGAREPRVPGPSISEIQPGRIGHTRPINPMVEGTGLPGQEKPPRYDKQGHTV